jgi:hypothetical protein
MISRRISLLFGGRILSPMSSAVELAVLLPCRLQSKSNPYEESLCQTAYRACRFGIGGMARLTVIPRQAKKVANQ